MRAPVDCLEVYAADISRRDGFPGLRSHCAQVHAFQFEWTPESEAAFAFMKHALTSSPVVVLPDFADPFQIYTDALKDTVVGVLAPDRDGSGGIVVYASQAQKLWSTFDRELRVNSSIMWDCLYYCN